MLKFEFYFLVYCVVASVIFFFFQKTSEYFEHKKLIFIIPLIETIGLIIFSEDQFAFMRLLAHIIFIHVPIILVWLAHWYKIKWPIVFVLILGVIACYSFWYEPQNLKVTHYKIKSNKITKSYKLALLADIQTDHVSEYDREMTAMVKAIDPDFLIFTGDYIQCDNINDHNRQMNLLRGLLQPLTQKYPSYVSGGDVDREDWPLLFDSKAKKAKDVLRTNFEEIKITGLNEFNSFKADYNIAKSDSFHLIFGHGPDYVLGNIAADLCLAGHTHGGQVQIPLFGPIMTLSKIPRRWASGMSETGWSEYLIVSNGIGLERANAPRLRFNCAPEIVVVELLPLLD